MKRTLQKASNASTREVAYMRHARSLARHPKRGTQCTTAPPSPINWHFRADPGMAPTRHTAHHERRDRQVARTGTDEHTGQASRAGTTSGVACPLPDARPERGQAPKSETHSPGRAGRILLVEGWMPVPFLGRSQQAQAPLQTQVQPAIKK